MHHGLEIALFFNSFGKSGFYGIIVSAVVISLVIYKVFSTIYKYNISTYSDFLKETLGMNKNIIICFFENIINIFLLMSFFVMISGILTFFKQELGINNLFFSIFIVLICYLVLIRDLDGVIKINSLLIPILIFCIIFVGIKYSFFIDTNIYTNLNNNIKMNWLVSSLIYTSYNCIVLIPILISLKKEINEKRQIKMISCFSGIIIGVLGIIIYRLLFLTGNEINKIEMPLVFVIGKFGVLYKCIYGLVVLFAIFTSVISSGYAFLDNVTKNKKQYKTICLMICSISIIISNVVFSNLVNVLYPIFGTLGLIQIIYIFFFLKI